MAEKGGGGIIGVDVGGTFTDLVQIAPDGSLKIAKTPTTPSNQALGVLAAIEAAGADLPAVDLIVHGTTTTTNAVLERKLARTGLITTRGFRDVLELGRRTRPQAYGMSGTFRPVIPRDLRFEVEERMLADGTIHIPLDEAGIESAARALLAAGCESVVVHFLHAYANPAHEKRAGEIIASLWPNDHITLAHEILSEAREFERGVTAAVNASVRPLIERYVEHLASALGERGYRRELLIVNGNGGMVGAASVGQEAVKTVMSGPASGVMAAAWTGRQAGITNLITYDMGGTSTDVALIRGGEPGVSGEIEIEYAMPIHVPMVDVRTVGAGGGSIARVNAAGLLEVGPESAGADPGPICYGRGGEAPTISDANLLLGRLAPPPGTKGAAEEADALRARVESIFAARLADPLGLSPVEAAEAVIRVANTHMAGAIRMVSLSLGADPRDFALFAFGGAGPLHAAALARELGVPRVLVPPRPGITNAIGCAVADLRHDFVRTLNRPLDAVDEAGLHEIIADQRRRGEALIGRESIGMGTIRHLHSVDMQFIGQTHLLRVPLDGPAPTRRELQARFESAYRKRFKVELPEIRANLVNVNTSVIGTRPPLDLTALIRPEGRKESLEDAQTGRRPVRINGRWHETPIYRRDLLPLDARITGPAVIEQMDTTILIEPGDLCVGDRQGNLLITIGGAGYGA